MAKHNIQPRNGAEVLRLVHSFKSDKRQAVRDLVAGVLGIWMQLDKSALNAVLSMTRELTFADPDVLQILYVRGESPDNIFEPIGGLNESNSKNVSL